MLGGASQIRLLPFCSPVDGFGLNATVGLDPSQAGPHIAVDHPQCMSGFVEGCAFGMLANDQSSLSGTTAWLQEEIAMPPTGSYPLKTISPLEVAFSDSNPRGESEDQILKDETFERLKESVFRFGVLVPIVVHEHKGDPDKPYKLVDGERRLRAALAAGVKRIPAHIASSQAPTDDLVQAVHIHMLRKQWAPVAQARAIRRLISERRRTEPGFSEEEALEELQALTGCTDTKLKSLRRAAQYPEKVLSAVERSEINFQPFGAV